MNDVGATRPKSLSLRGHSWCTRTIHRCCRQTDGQTDNLRRQ